MCIAKDTAVEKVCVGFDEALRIQSAAHVVDICLPIAVQPGEIISTQ
jgi:hypothetical protein